MDKARDIYLVEYCNSKHNAKGSLCLFYCILISHVVLIDFFHFHLSIVMHNNYPRKLEIFNL